MLITVVKIQLNTVQSIMNHNYKIIFNTGYEYRLKNCAYTYLGITFLLSENSESLFYKLLKCCQK